MKLNTKIRYGLRTMVEIALHNHAETGILQKTIADKQQISNKYLDHIIPALKSKGLISNVHGKKSGYQLMVKPEHITVYDIYQAFENELNIVDDITEQNNCDKQNSCAALEMWMELNHLQINYMKSKTLKDISDKQKILNEQKQNMYYI